MSFNDWSSAISDLVQAAAIMIGGTWAYFKFVRGRTFRYRATLHAEAGLFVFEGEPVIRVQVGMKNEGLSRIDLSLEDESQVIVYAALAETWLPDVSADWNEASPVRRTALFENHTWIESGETIDDDLLIPLGGPKQRPVAYRVRAVVRAPRVTLRGMVRSVLGLGATRPRVQVWTEDLVVPISLEPRHGGSKDQASTIASKCQI